MSIFRKLISVLSLSTALFAQNINLAVSANVSYAIPSIIKEFNKINPNIKVKVTLGSSGKLTNQIKHGAPYDIFLSANMEYPHKLYQDKIAITAPVIYARGKLALFSTKKYDLSSGIKVLLNSNIQTIAIANPKFAPYGKAALQSLKNSKIYTHIKPKLVYTGSASQTISYTLIATDIGLIAQSSLYTPTMSKYLKNIDWIDVNSKLYTPINQGMVILKYGSNTSDIKKLYDFILSKKSQQIFKKFGYSIP